MVSGYTDSQITAILSGVNHLKGLVGRLLATSASSLPTIDFAVDMFDRGNQGVLDGYWQDDTGSWTLRGGKAICQSSQDIHQTSLGSVSDSCEPWGNQVGETAFFTFHTTRTLNIFGAVATRADNMYAGKFSSPDLNIELTFEVPSGYNVARTSVVTVNNNGAIITTNTDPTLIPIANCGATFGNAGGRSLGTTMEFGIVPAYSDPGGQATTPAVPYNPSGLGPDTLTVTPRAYPEVKVSAIEFGSQDFTRTTVSGASINSSVVETETFTPAIPTAFPVTATRSTITSFTASTVNFVAGTNTLLMTAVGNVYTVTLNGVLLYTTTAELMIDRLYCGITAFPENILNTIITNALSYYGITRFRAWINGGADPGFQTGRGTYASGRYNDKYHSYSPSGSVTYNPLA